jgi:hypothetical protein
MNAARKLRDDLIQVAQRRQELLMTVTKLALGDALAAGDVQGRR